MFILAILSFHAADADFIHHSCCDDLKKKKVKSDFFFLSKFIYRSGNISASHASAGISGADSIIE